MSEGYSEDLSYVHDAGFGQFAEAAASYLLDVLNRHREEMSSDIDVAMRGRKRIVDLGCGSGIFAATLSDAGYDVLGVDISQPFIDLARKRAPRAEFRCASLLDIDIPPCGTVTAIGECVNYLFDERHSADGVWELFRRVYGALVPGGLFLFDAAGPGRAGPAGHTTGHTEGVDWFVAYSADEEANVLTRRMTTFRRDGDTYRRTAEIHRLQLLSPLEVVDRLREVGFRVTELDGYGPVKLPSGWRAFLASK